MSLSSALQTGDLTLLPGRRDEDWRWTDLRGLLRSLPPKASVPTISQAGAGPLDGLADEVFFLASGSETAEIVIEAGAARTLALRTISRGPVALAVSAIIRVGSGAKLTLLESSEGDDSAYVTNADLNFDIGEGAEVERIVLAYDGADGIFVSQARVRLGAGARFSQTIATSGARRQRLETSVDHPGAGASVRLNGIYLLADKRHADLTTTVRHLGVDGETSQLTKGVVRDQARGVFQGRIIVEEGADRTEARMGHHALVLSDKAEVDARPELLIHADDVQCAHGNTIGALDEEALFYMEQRGLPEPVARSLLISAFVSEAAAAIASEPARRVVETWISGKMEVAR